MKMLQDVNLFKGEAVLREIGVKELRRILSLPAEGCGLSAASRNLSAVCPPEK